MQVVFFMCSFNLRAVNLPYLTWCTFSGYKDGRKVEREEIHAYWQSPVEHQSTIEQSLGWVEFEGLRSYQTWVFHKFGWVFHKFPENGEFYIWWFLPLTGRIEIPVRLLYFRGALHIRFSEKVTILYQPLNNFLCYFGGAAVWLSECILFDGNNICISNIKHKQCPNLFQTNRGDRIVFWWPNTNTNIIRFPKNDRIWIEYEYNSVSQKWPITNTNIIRFPKDDRIRIRILFGFPKIRIRIIFG